MKKKLALLLVLSMILSTLPMNVFGNVINVSPPGGGGSYVSRIGDSGFKRHFEPWGTLQERFVHDWKVAINLQSHQAVNATPSSLSVLVNVVNGRWAGFGGGDHIGWLEWDPVSGNAADNARASYFKQNVGRTLPRTGGGVGSNENRFNVTFEALSATMARLTINSPSVNLGAVSDNMWYVVVEGLYIQPDGDSTPIVTIGSDRTPSEQINTSLVTTPARARNLSVSVANPTAGETFLYFDELRITESVRGDFTHGHADNVKAVITMRAPNNYRWVRPPDRQNIGVMDNVTGSNIRTFLDSYTYTTRFGDNFVRLSGESFYQNPSSISMVRNPQTAQWENPTANEYLRHNRYLTIHLALDRNIMAGAPAERIGLRGIGLVADNRADYSSVSVAYAIDWVTIQERGDTPANRIVASTIDGWWGERSGNQWTMPRRDMNDHLWQSFEAGTRTWNESGFDLRPGTEPTTIRSGDQGHARYFTIRGDVGEGGQPTLFTYNEYARGTVASWHDDGGFWTQWVRLNENAVGALGLGLGMEATFSVPDHGGAKIMGVQVLMPRANFQGYPYETRPNDWENAGYAAGHDIIGGWNYASARGVLVTPEYVRFTPGWQGWEERTALRHVDMRFLLSVEPGYEHKYGEDIEITVTGPAVAQLVGSNSVVAALARDPITLDMDVADITIVDNNAYNVAVREIEDIVIREADFGQLRKGDELWVYVVGARANEVEFTADMVAEVNTDESGLILTRGSVLRHRWSNSWVNGIRFTVEERSHDRASRNNSDVGEVIITGGRITGPVYPGVNYEIVVSGTAVAANQYSVFENRRGSATLSSYDAARNASWRLFDTEPYATPAFEFDLEGSTPPPVEIEVILPPAATVSQSLTLNEWSPEINGVRPFVMVQVDENTRVGMVSPRVIAEFFGGSADWDAGSGTATITGKHKDGSDVVVTLQAAATSGTINGSSQDIATYSGSAAPGTVQVYTSASNNFYVPMRFMTNAFGYTIDWNPATATATIRN